MLSTTTLADSNKLCKNIAIFGSCKYEGRGCAFSHDAEVGSADWVPFPRAWKGGGISTIYGWTILTDGMQQNKRNASVTPTPSRPSTPSSGLTASSLAFTPNAAVFTPSSANTSLASPSLSRNTANLSAQGSNLASLAASANVFIPKSAKSAVSTPKAEETPQPQFAPSSTSAAVTSSASTGTSSAKEDGQMEQDDDLEEEEEEFDGLNPYAAVQSPASTSGALPTLSSSYQSAQSTRSTHSAPSAPQSSYDPQTPSFEPAYPVHGQARIPDEGHAGQQQEYGYDSYASEGHVMHNQAMESSNPYLNGAMPGMEMYSQGMHQPVSLDYATTTHLHV